VGKDRWYLRYNVEAGYQGVYLSSVIIDTSLLDVKRQNYNDYDDTEGANA